MLLKGLYTLLLGVFLTLFVGIGISTFYPEPVYQTPIPCLTPLVPPLSLPQIKNGTTQPATSPKKSATQDTNQKCVRAQNKINEAKGRYVQIISSILLVAAVVFTLISLVIVRQMDVFSQGFLFGSMFTLLYSVVRGLSSNLVQFEFILISVSLIFVIAVGYIRFVKESIKK